MKRQLSDLRPYQHRVTTFLYEHDEAFAVVRMGGGKTASALTAIAELLRDGAIRHALIVAPLRVANNVWPDEIDAWAHLFDLRYAVLNGSPQRRQAQLLAASGRHLTIIGLDNLKWLVEQLSADGVYDGLFDLLVIDEISRLRNPKGKRAQALCKITKRFKMIWGLTGTIRPSSAEDLFMPAKVVTRGKLWGRSFYQWQREHFHQDDWRGHRWSVMPHSNDKLNADIAPYCVTLADDELPQIPKLTVQFDKIQLPPDARDLYDQMEEKLIAQLADRDILAASSAVATGKCAQIANGFIYDADRVVSRVHEEKRAWLEDLVEEAAGEPLLLLYEFLPDLEMIREVVSGRLAVLGADRELKDEAIIREWNNRALPFLAMHPASGGHGLNLQAGGSTMGWVAPTWGAELWQQTLARLHRPGQKFPVLCRVCQAEFTVDDLKIYRVFRKLSAQEAFEQYLRDRAARRRAASTTVQHAPTHSHAITRSE